MYRFYRMRKKTNKTKITVCVCVFFMGILLSGYLVDNQGIPHRDIVRKKAKLVPGIGGSFSNKTGGNVVAVYMT